MSKQQAQAGPNLGAIAANASHLQQNSAAPSHSSSALPAAQDINLGEHPVKIPSAIPTLGAGSAIQIPGGVEGYGALSPTTFDLGNHDPFGLPKQAMLGLHQVNNVGDIGADKISPGEQLNAMKDHGIGAVEALSSAPSQGGH